MKIFDFQQVIRHLLSLQIKKSSPTVAVIVAFTVCEIKKNQKFYETRIYFLYNDPRI